MSLIQRISEILFVLSMLSLLSYYGVLSGGAHMTGIREKKYGYYLPLSKKEWIFTLVAIVIAIISYRLGFTN